MDQQPKPMDEQRLDAIDMYSKKASRVRCQLGFAINQSLELARGSILKEDNERISQLLDNYDAARATALNQPAPQNADLQDLIFDLMEVISMMTQNFSDWRNGIQTNSAASSESPAPYNANINIKPEPVEEAPEVQVITIDEASSSSSSSSPNQAGSSQAAAPSYTFVTPPSTKNIFPTPPVSTHQSPTKPEHIYDPNKEIKKQPLSSFDVAAMEQSGASPTRPAKRRAQNFFYGEVDDEDDEVLPRQQIRASVLMTTPRTQQASVIVTGVHSAPAAPGQYVCDRCDKTFAKEAGLKRHVLVHNGIRCPKCSVFMAKDKLAGHMRKLHRGFKAASVAPGTLSDDEGDVDVDGVDSKDDHVFAVPALPPRLMRAASEAVHGSNKFPCNVCGLEFKSPGGVNKHMVIHKRGNDERQRFKCPHCAITRTVMSMIKCHIRQDHGIDPYDCDVCGETFARKSYLVEHRVRRHGARASMARESMARSEISMEMD